jgi:hypothetical protein
MTGLVHAFPPNPAKPILSCRMSHDAFAWDAVNKYVTYVQFALALQQCLAGAASKRNACLSC